MNDIDFEIIKPLLGKYVKVIDVIDKKDGIKKESTKKAIGNTYQVDVGYGCLCLRFLDNLDYVIQTSSILGAKFNNESLEYRIETKNRYYILKEES